MKRHPAILGAAFLMATSAIGPGFLTQTSKFTEELLTSFGFVILISLILDIGAQLNIWTIISVSRKNAQDIAENVFPGLGIGLACLIGFGGFVFNIGNIGGTGLGLEALTGMDNRVGSILSCLAALGIFWYKEAGLLVDRIVKWLGILMIIFTLYIAIKSNPPFAEALYRTIWPERIDFFKIVTLVGGTVGGYISFAGAHRLLDAGISGKENLSKVSASAVNGIVLTSVMRFILFFAALGVVWHGARLDPSNPAASVFQHAAGETGFRFFGFVMWCASITSVIGASYTSVSFLRTIHPLIEKNKRVIITAFIIASTIVFLCIGNPVLLLIMAGALNGLILPIALALMLVAVRRINIAGNYKHPAALQIAGWLVVILMCWMGSEAIRSAVQRLI